MGLLYLVNTSARAQTTIKERVGITPGTTTSNAHPNGHVARTASLDNIRVELSWSPGPPNVDVRMYLQAPCLISFDTALYASGGILISYTFAAPRLGTYLVSPQACVVSPDSVTCTTRIYVNDSLVAHNEGIDLLVGCCGGYCLFPGGSAYNYDPPYFNTFKVYSYAEAIYGHEYTSIYLEGSNDCSFTRWFPAEDEVTLTITAGGQYSSFHNDNDDSLGGTVTGLIAQLEQMRLVADGVEPPAGGAPVTITATSAGITAQGTVIVRPRGPLTLDFYNVYDFPLPYGSDIPLFVHCVNDFGDEFAPPEGTTYKFDVLDGSQWGWFGGRPDGTVRDTLTCVQDGGRTVAVFSVMEAIPDTQHTVTFRVTPSDASIGVGTHSFTVGPQVRPYIEVSFDPPTVAPGDTALVILQRRTEEGTLASYPETETFDVSIRNGGRYGVLLADRDTAQQFTEIGQGFKLIAADSIDVDSAHITVLVHPPSVPSGPMRHSKERVASIAEKSPPVSLREVQNKTVAVHSKRGSGAVTLDDFGFDGAGVGKLLVTKGGHTILLGETKYYQAREDPHYSDRLTIEERLEPTQLTGNGWLTTDVWATNPPVRRASNTVGRVGVYWEKGRPIPTDPQKNLDDGLIRLVGRYWHSDTTYKVTLTAAIGTRVGSIDIEVEKPKRLGSNLLATHINQGIDIASHRFSVDSMCIKWGGIYGIPPQHIKSQISIESVYDPRLQAVCPAYRYEPWSTELRDQDVADLEGNTHFWVTLTPSSMGNGNAVPMHQNTRYMSYVQEAHSVWYFIEQYSSIVQSPAPYGGDPLFGYRAANGNLVFSHYSLPRNEYRPIREREYARMHLLATTENTEANRVARERFITYFRDQYRSGRWIGLNSRPAQSRVASSYGPIQTMYTTAIARQYPTGRIEIPENLNISDTFFPFAMAHYVVLLENQFGSGNPSSSNWSQGFETALKGVYHGWNPSRRNYDQDVMQAAANFQPVH